MMRRRLLAAGLSTGLGLWCGPSAASIGPLRRRALPRLAGITDGSHVALTFDDGPDPVSTPSFLDLLDAHQRRATFFLMGEHVAAHPRLVADMSRRGHELGVHGWDHRPTALTSPARLTTELTRTAGLLSDVSGRPVRWYRPPYGVLSAAALVAARRAGLRTVLWSAWGRDWEARATPASVVRIVERTLRPGGTVLLHDTDRTSAPGSWITTLAATASLLDAWAEAGWQVGPLGEHLA